MSSLSQKWVYISIIPSLLLLVGFYYFVSNSKVAKCPEDFNNMHQAGAAFDSWIEEYTEASPDASYEEIKRATIQMYLHNRCKAALERIAEHENEQEDSGNLNSLKEAAIRI